MATNCPVPLGETFAGKYRVDRILGEGGMGVVVAAHHLELDQTVAIKFLLDGVAGGKEGAERFRREARAAARIQSDHVVRVLDVGLLENGDRYMVMEYMDGKDLADELLVHGTFPLPVATTFMLEALDAIGHAHAVGIVHRDLKPANLFLARRGDGSSRVKVLDFGISKTFGSASASELSLTKTSAWMGSPLYMSPEQMQSARDVDHRADIWSMGAIYYELLTGQPPYQAESLPQLCSLLLTADPVDVRSLRPDLPPELGQVIMRCLSRNVETRIQSAQELALLIQPYSSAAGQRTSRGPVYLDRTEMGTGVGVGNPTLGSTGVPAPRPVETSIPNETVRGHSATVPDQPAHRKKWGLWAGIAALAVGGLLAFSLFTQEQTPAVSGAGPAPAPVQDDTSSRGAPAVASPPPAAPPVAATVAPTISAPSLPTERASGASVAPSAAASARPKPKPAPARPASSAEGDFSEFGGRR